MWIRIARWGALLCALSVAAWPAARASEPKPDSAAEWLEAPLLFHVAERGGEPVADEKFLKRQLSMANRIFAPHDIRFVRAGRRPLPGRHAELVSRHDRDVLAQYVRSGVVDVFVVARLMDVDEPGRVRRGVHWRPRQAPERRLIIVSAISMDDVLAHELGHFLGNRRHSDVPGNLMSYQRTEGLPFLNPHQVKKARATLSRMHAQGALGVGHAPQQPGTPPK